VLCALIVNDRPVEIEVAVDETLLDVLRRDLRLTGSKAACQRGECGACTVLVGDDAVMSCVVPALLVDRPVTTIEGLEAQTTELRGAFAERGGLQCGFCTPGQVVRAAALLRDARRNGVALDDATVRDAMAGNICRCTGYSPIVDAILDVATRPPDREESQAFP
jgi:aerobic-type carbon monoxide dehydrogenase small subunit (CoxS/CutS family)